MNAECKPVSLESVASPESRVQAEIVVLYVDTRMAKPAVPIEPPSPRPEPLAPDPVPQREIPAVPVFPAPAEPSIPAPGIPAVPVG